MQSQLKSFSCKLHPSEPVQRVFRSQDADNSLRCVECILENIDNAPKNAFMSLNDFIEEAVRHYASSSGSQTLEGSVPNELVEFLSSEENNISKLKQYIDQEKAKVIDVFDSLQQKFTQLCQSKKEDLCKQLDLQVDTLKLNYRYYESTIHRHFNQDSHEGGFNKDTLISKINECENTSELEVVVKRIKDDLRAASTFMNRNEAKTVLRESLQSLADELQTIAQIRPKTSFIKENYHEELLKDFDELIKPFIESCSQVTCKVEELSFNKSLSINSNFLRQSDLDLFKKWIDPSCDILPRMRLLYRASRNGFSLKSFHDHCDSYENTLVIIKSEEGKIYGGFSDQLWNSKSNSSPSQSKKSWLFSLSERAQYSTPSDKIFSIIGNYGAGICFGSQPDFSIVFGSDLDLGAYQNLGILGLPQPNLQPKAYGMFCPVGYKDPTKSSDSPQDDPLSLLLKYQSGPGQFSPDLFSQNQIQPYMGSPFMQSPTALTSMLQDHQQILNMQRLQVQINEQQRLLQLNSKGQKSQMNQFSFPQPTYPVPTAYFPIKEIEVFHIVSK